MTKVDVSRSTLESCVSKAQSERVIVTRKGTPVALVVGLEGMDREQIELGSSDKFWRMIQNARKQKTVTREELEKSIAAKKKRQK